MPVRLYRIDPGKDHKAVRLVYRMGSNEYWGVQMTDWDDAPALADKSLTRRIGGRAYDLYYDGAEAAHGRPADAEGELLGDQHAPRPPLERDDDRDRQGAPSRSGKPGSRRMKVAVFGAGYVGLVTGACFADLGHDVVVRDIVADKIDALRRGEVPIHEDGPRRAARAKPRAPAASRPRSRRRSTGADFVYVAVGTPPTYSGDADLSAVWTVVDELPAGRAADRRRDEEHGPGRHGRAVRHRLDERGLENVGYVSNPEFTAEGTAVRDFMHPDRIVIGAFDAADADVVERLHAGIDAPVVRCDVASAEMIKLAANAALVTRISFINEIANVCEATGADVLTVAEGIGLDRRIGPSFLRAGIGFGGSCFPKDSLALKQLAANSGYNFQLLNAVIEVNELQKRRVIGKLERRLGVAPRQEGRAPRARVQAGHGRHARGAEPRPRRPAARRGRRGQRLGPGRGRQAPPRRRGDRGLGARGARGRGCRRPRDRVAGAPRARLGRGRRRACATGCSSTAATCSTPTSCVRSGSTYEGIGSAPAE